MACGRPVFANAKACRRHQVQKEPVPTGSACFPVVGAAMQAMAMKGHASQRCRKAPGVLLSTNVPFVW